MSKDKEKDKKDTEFSWACLDGDYRTLGKHDSSELREVFKKLAEGFTEELGNLVAPKKERLIFAGGNYSHLFLFQYFFDVLDENRNHLPIELKLFEAKSKVDVKRANFDILIFGQYTQSKTDMREWYIDAGYKVSDVFMEDNLYVGASKEAIEKCGGKANTLKQLPLLFGRNVVSHDGNKVVVMPYSIKPKGREDEESRISSDQYLLSYKLMKQNNGIWYCVDSMKDLDIVRLEDTPRTTVYRYFVYKKEYESLVNKLMKIGRKIL